MPLRNNFTDGSAFTHTDQNDVANEVNAKVDKATLTAKGDLFVATASGAITNLAVGPNAQVLTADSTQASGVKWAAPTQIFTDGTLTVQDNTDATKQVKFEVSGITTGTTRTFTLPDANTTLVGTDTTQTLTNKSLTSPAITSPTGITKADVGLGNVDNTSTTTISQSLRANRNLNGGGIFTVDASGNVKWSNRMMVISNGRGTNFATDGYFTIDCPVIGTVTGVGGAANKTATAAGIPLTAYEALYYILPIGSGHASVAANFRVALYTGNLNIPHDWVLICVRSDSNVFTFNNGITLRPGESLNCITQDTASTVNTLVRRDASGNFSAGTITATLSGNAATATTLATARTINGVSFNGSANITVADSTKEPTITAGTTAQYYRGDKSFQTLNADAVPDGTTNKAFLATEKTKLTGIATGATANSTDATLLARTNHTGTQLAATISDFSTAADARVTAGITGKENTSNKGIANGYASLDSGGKVPVSQLPNSIMEYQGTWNASTNTPTLANGTGSAGDVYRVSVAGTALSLTFEVGDYIIYNGSTWEKSDTTDAVASIAGRTGNVTLTSADVGLGNVDNTSDATKNAAAVALTNKTSVTSTGVVSGTQLVSTVATGQAPLSIASTTQCPNLNATYVGGLVPVTTATGTSVAARDSSANLTANAFTSTVATGTAPFTVASTTNVANLNASYLQGYVGNTGAVASTFALRDANANITADNFINSVESTVAAGGTKALTLASAAIQVFTSNGSQTVLMPTTDVVAGQKWTIINQQSTGSVAIQSSTGAAIVSLPAGYAADLTVLANTPTTAAHWRASLWAQTAGLIATTSNTLAAFSQSTTNTIGVGNIELGHATDTTLSRSAAGTLAVEGVNVLMTGGALGTPSSGTLTNCTFPTLNQNTTGTAANVTGTVAVANGGTGSTTLTLNNVLLGNGTSALQAVAPGTTGNVLTSNGTTWTSAAPTGGGVSRVTSTITTATTLGAVANTEYLAYIASGGSVTLPTAVGNTSLYTLKNTDTTTKTIATQGDDASFASVTALLRGNGDDASTVFTDSSGKYAWTGAANVRLSTAVKKFGTASIYFGAGGNNANINASTLPGMGAGDFTIEMWFYSTVTAPQYGYYLYDPRPYQVNGVYPTLYVGGSNDGANAQKLIFMVSSAGRCIGTTTVTTNAWHHAAVSRSGGVTRLFLNGVQEGSSYTDTNNYLIGAGGYVGNTTAFVNGVWAGYVDDVRVTQGVGRYTANFTPPTAEFPITQLIDGNYPLVLAPNQAIELASSGSNWSVVSDAAPIPALTTTPTSATTTTLTVASTPIQVFTGTTTHTVKLPSTGIVAGRQFTVINNSTGLLTMQTSTAAQIHVLASGTESILTALINSPTTAAHWEDSFIATNFAAGKALTVNNSLTLAGTDATTMTFPGASDTVVTLAAAQTLTNKTLTTPTLTTPVINSTPTGTGVATAATASTLALRDANANLTADNFINVVDSTVTAAGTTTLTIASGGTQVFTGTTTQTVLLPTTGIVQGQQYTFINNSTGAVTVRPSGGVGSVATMLGGGWVAIVTATASTPTTTAHWTSMQVAAGTQGVFPASGSVLSTTNATSFSGKTFDFGSNTITGTLAQFNTAVTDADLVSLAGTETLTNKRITPRVVSVASSATPAINTDNGDVFNLTSLATNVTSMTTSLTGTPTDGQRMIIRIKSAAAQTIAWGASFISSGVAILPTATLATKTHLVGFIYDSVALKWVCVASDGGGY